MPIDTNKLKTILNNSVAERLDFIKALQDGDAAIKDFFRKHARSELYSLRRSIVVGATIDAKNLREIKDYIKREFQDTEPIEELSIDRKVESTPRKSESSSVSSVTNSFSESTGVDSDHSETEVTHNIRGRIQTYEIDMMGGFNCDLVNSNIQIKADSKIRRPSKVTGVLGSTAGDHVIPLALFVNNIQEDIKSKTPHEAITIVTSKVSQLDVLVEI